MKLSDYMHERDREEDPSIELQRPTAADPMWLVRKNLAPRCDLPHRNTCVE